MYTIHGFCVTLLIIFEIFHSKGDNIGDEDIRCTEKSCTDVDCDAVSDKCRKNGVFLLSPDVCNCCEYCLENIGEGEPCSVGEPSNGKHTSLCGPGLTCIPTKMNLPDGTCQKMSTACTLLQDDYDTRRKKGFLGQMELRTNCNDDGLFSNYKCIPGQTCYCQHSNGTRIFGEANYSTVPDYMTCECSRKYYDAVELIGRDLGPHEHFRCDTSGNYDRMQCINEKCLCVDPEDGAPTYPDRSLVNITLISKDTLPCYSFDMTGEYYKKCEGDYVRVLKEVEKLKKLGYKDVLGYVFPKCDLDGTYMAVQENKTHKYCVDKEGSVLAALNKTEKASLAATMDCKCVRANILTSTSEKPKCLENGNYDPVQCRRGTCRCVDSDGNQACASKTKECQEVDESLAEKLSC